MNISVPLEVSTPDLASYDVILINSSAGKDSQAMLTHVVEQCDAAGVGRWRIIVVHADLGRVEWPGTLDLARRHAEAYGLYFEVVRRELGDLLDQIAQRGKFPSATARYCTSDHKTAQVAKLMTRLAKAHRRRNPSTLFRPIRILNCLGIRAEESHARAKKVPFGPDKAATNSRRIVDRWLPIFTWTQDQVWTTIRRSGLPHHPAYDLGMPRLSCVFCVLAGSKELVLAAQHNPALAEEYAAVEQRIGHTFKADLSMAEILRRAKEPVR
ncbi:phosphoadenosine phosphosulfate reductase family protein [Lentzea atacamensis]|uniref:Phosphoadenosine phosphosulfate reductase family protein n=1 Tax=Lentzea atacamensis TaxID=531938 RepID=A0ABX9DZ51_9PSEU|nr:phosphoadenosine phosphosulfate reductase family protein [Lentzea atacamensis]RAS59492.1 phosphoadenosine phosphosulfate reductase family protein [Lentzea atacamensis]